MAVRSTPLIPLRSLKAYYSIYMSLNTLDLPPFDRVLNTLQCDVHCGHPMRRQPVISEFKVAISKKCPMNPGFTVMRSYEDGLEACGIYMYVRLRQASAYSKV